MIDIIDSNRTSRFPAYMFYYLFIFSLLILNSWGVYSHVAWHRLQLFVSFIVELFHGLIFLFYLHVLNASHAD